MLTQINKLMKKLLTLILLLTTTQLYSTETYKLKLTKE